MYMNCLRSWIEEMATIEAMSRIFSPLMPTLPIQGGRSGWSPTSILETKFS